MDIIFCLDDNFVMQTGVAITSICVNNKNVDINFYLISTGLNENSQMDLRHIVTKYNQEVYFYTVDNSLLDNCPVNIQGQCETTTIATYLKLFIVNILPCDIEKVLYLDGDLIIRSSLIELWNTDISKVSLAAVRDIYSGDIRRYNRLCYYDPSFGYVNTGVMLLNLKYWREHNILEKCIEYMLKYPNRLIVKEQDLINAVLVGKIEILSFKYNVQTLFYMKKSALFLKMDCFEELDDAIKCPVILHYICYPKPWLKEYDMPYKDEWIKYQNMTNWKNLKQNHMKNWLVYSFKNVIRKMIGKNIPFREDLPKY